MLTLEFNSLWNGLRNRTWRKWGTHNSHCTLNTVIRWVHYTIQLHTFRFCFLLNFVSFFCLFVIFLVDLNADLSFYFFVWFCLCQPIEISYWRHWDLFLIASSSVLIRQVNTGRKNVVCETLWNCNNQMHVSIH